MSFRCFCNLPLKIIFLYLLLFFHIGKQSRAQEKKCGRALTEALSLFCVNGFNSRIRRSSEQESDNLNISPPTDGLYYRLKEIFKNYEPDFNESNPNVSNLKEHKILIRKRKQVYVVTAKGVADECCVRACAYDEIIQYCA